MMFAAVGFRPVASSSPNIAPRNVTSSMSAVETALISAPGYDQTSGQPEPAVAVERDAERDRPSRSTPYRKP